MRPSDLHGCVYHSEQIVHFDSFNSSYIHNVRVGRENSRGNEFMPLVTTVGVEPRHLA
jgi:hypothetical protein